MPDGRAITPSRHSVTTTPNAMTSASLTHCHQRGYIAVIHDRCAHPASGRCAS